MLRTPYKRPGFTLIEVLVVITIIGIIAGLGLGALFQAQEVARRSRTKGLIARLHTQISSRWDSYRTRRLPIDFYGTSSVAGLQGSFFDPTTPGLPRRVSGNVVSGISGRKLAALRELMRMELPDNYGDLVFQPNPLIWSNEQNPGGSMLINNPSQYRDSGNVPIPTFPALRMAYLRRVQAVNPNRSINDIINVDDPTTGKSALAAQFQSAECLYLIMTTGFGDENSDGQAWHTRDVADTDNDGMPEFIDGWGTPIEFIRWPAGFYSELQPVNPLTGEHDPTINPDPFDPRGVDRVLYDSSQPPASQSTPRGYALFPLIVSAGPDGTGRNDPRGSFGIYFRQATVSDPYLFYPDASGGNRVQRGAVIPASELSPATPPSDPNDAFEVSRYAGGSAADNITNHQIDATQ